MNKRLVKIINQLCALLLASVITLFVVSLNVNTTQATERPSVARSVAMGGAYIALAKGVDAPFWNPANLGLSSNSKFSMNLISLGIGIHNNSFSKEQYDLYNGAFLGDRSKKDILNSIPEDGLRFYLDMEGQFLGLSAGHFALTGNLLFETELSLAKDYLNLILYGNEPNRQYVFDDTGAEALAIYSYTFSAGFPIKLNLPYTKDVQEISVGVNLKYLQGLFYGKVVEAKSSFITTEENMYGYGKARIQLASGGKGMALDLGAASIINDRWTVSLGLRNIFSNITWNREAQIRSVRFSLDSTTVQSLSDAEADSVWSTEETTQYLAAFSSSLPAEFQIGTAYFRNKLTITMDYIQGFQKAPGVSTKPRICAGLEFRGLSWLPLRTGLALGGREGLNSALGLGLRLGFFAFDIAISNRGGLAFWGQRGAALALGFNFWF